MSTTQEILGKILYVLHEIDRKSPLSVVLSGSQWGSSSYSSKLLLVNDAGEICDKAEDGKDAQRMWVYRRRFQLKTAEDYLLKLAQVGMVVAQNLANRVVTPQRLFKYDLAEHGVPRERRRYASCTTSRLQLANTRLASG